MFFSSINEGMSDNYKTPQRSRDNWMLDESLVKGILWLVSGGRLKWVDWLCWRKTRKRAVAENLLSRPAVSLKDGDLIRFKCFSWVVLLLFQVQELCYKLTQPAVESGGWKNWLKYVVFSAGKPVSCALLSHWCEQRAGAGLPLSQSQDKPGWTRIRWLTLETNLTPKCA